MKICRTDRPAERKKSTMTMRGAPKSIESGTEGNERESIESMFNGYKT